MVSQYQLTVEIDRTQTGGTFTNHDVIKGRVVLKNSKEITLESIQVKLEGVSNTALVVEKWNFQRNRKERRRITCTHKLLYDTSIAFPPKNVRDVAKSSKFTLIPGEYSYPFQFKIPLKNSCYKDTIQNESINGLHIVEKLPPSLSGYDEFASIKYFVKVTAKRSNMFKVNLRSYDPFLFLPVDSPSLLARDAESKQSFVRKEFVLPNKLPEIVACYASPSLTKVVQYQRQVPRTSGAPHAQNGAANGGAGFFSRWLFGADPPASPSSSSKSATPTYEKIVTHQKRPVYKPTVKPVNVPIYFEARFRYPAYLIPTKSPLFRLYLKSKQGPKYFGLPNGESSGLGVVYIRSLKITLYDRTSVTIQGYQQTRTREVLLLDDANINCKVDMFAAKQSNTKSEFYELEIPKEIYKKAVVPDDVAPSFKSCNIEKSHQLILEMSCSSSKTVTSDDPLVKISIVSDVDIYSGLQNLVATDDHITPPTMPPPPMHTYSSESNGIVDINDQMLYAVSGNEVDDSLPSYDDVLHENYEGGRRRRFQAVENA